MPYGTEMQNTNAITGYIYPSAVSIINKSIKITSTVNSVFLKLALLL
jgi:hypothetical protein